MNQQDFEEEQRVKRYQRSSLVLTFIGSFLLFWIGYVLIDISLLLVELGPNVGHESWFAKMMSFLDRVGGG